MDHHKIIFDKAITNPDILWFVPFNDCILPTMLKPRRNKAVAENAFPRFFKKLSIVSGILAGYKNILETINIVFLSNTSMKIKSARTILFDYMADQLP